jgi:glutaredoxin
LLSDFWPHGAVAKRYGVLRQEGYTERAIFIIDRDGIIRYIDIHDIDEQPSNDVLFEELRKVIPEEFARYERENPSEEEPLPHGGVVMYCTAWCPECHKARAWLQDHNIEFKEVNIDKNLAAERQVKEWANGTRTTPTFDIDGTIVVDYDEDRLKELLIK